MQRTLDHFGITDGHPGAAIGARWLDEPAGPRLAHASPVDGSALPGISVPGAGAYDQVLAAATDAFLAWRLVPAPERGRAVRAIADAVRAAHEPLARLVSWEMGKPLAEARGEVQELLDVADYAVGLSRQLHGLVMASERPAHRLLEQWHPLGVAGVITAFNFPVAVWAWNTLIALVCGDAVAWKPSSRTPRSAIAIHRLAAAALVKAGAPEGVLCLLVGSGETVGERLAADPRVALLSLTGSTPVGKRAAATVAGRLGRSLLELGGNNAAIVAPSADLALAVRAATFAAVGTAGQRCTTLRRLIVHESVYERLRAALVAAYASLAVGSPLDEANHVGPLVDRAAVDVMQAAIGAAISAGGRLVTGGEMLDGPGYESGCYVRPAIVEGDTTMPAVRRETFAPILYLCRYTGSIEEAITIQNDSSWGLSSALFSDSVRETGAFLSAAGSDCGIANVNVGTSGAEVGGAFGGEKDTGGGRESGSDAWKAYMRRQTVTVNYGTGLPLAQGVRFGE